MFTYDVKNWLRKPYTCILFRPPMYSYNNAKILGEIMKDDVAKGVYANLRSSSSVYVTGVVTISLNTSVLNSVII